MNVMLEVSLNTINEKNSFVYHVRITQGHEQIDSEADLIRELGQSTPIKNGVIEVNQISKTLWEVITNNPNK